VTLIGITGSFGTGKSTVARGFVRLGARLIDADAEAQATFAPRGRVWRQLRRRFGKDVFHPDGAVDRGALAQAGFTSRRAWQDLCRIVHPAVYRRIRRKVGEIRRRNPDAVVVLDVPLLVESGMTGRVDWVVVVTAGRRAQEERLGRARRWTRAQIRQRLKWQMPLRDKARFAHAVIDNNGSRRSTEAQIQRFWRRLREER